MLKSLGFHVNQSCVIANINSTLQHSKNCLMQTWSLNEIWLSYNVNEYSSDDAVTEVGSIDFTVSPAEHRLLWLHKRFSSPRPARARCGHCANRSNYASDSIRKWDGLCDIWTRLIYLRKKCRKQCRSCILIDSFVIVKVK